MLNVIYYKNVKYYKHEYFYEKDENTTRKQKTIASYFLHFQRQRDSFCFARLGDETSRLFMSYFSPCRQTYKTEGLNRYTCRSP